MAIVALSGRAQVKVKELPPYALEPPPGQALLVWNNRRDQFDQNGLPELPKDFALAPPAPKLLKEAQDRAAMRKARNDLNGLLSGKDVNVEYKLGEAIAAPDSDPALRVLSVRCCGAINDTEDLIELLQSPNKEVRRAAIQTLEFWIVQDRDNDHALWPALKKRYKESEKIMELLHGETRPNLLPDYAENNPSPIVREMAQLRLEDLMTLSPPKKKKSP
jgi:hypothetical protein